MSWLMVGIVYLLSHYPAPWLRRIQGAQRNGPVSQRAKRTSAFRPDAFGAHPLTDDRAALRSGHLLRSDVASEAASELHSSRLVRPVHRFEIKSNLNDLAVPGTPFRASEAHRLPKKWRVCIGALGRSQGKAASRGGSWPIRQYVTPRGARGHAAARSSPEFPS